MTTATSSTATPLYGLGITLEDPAAVESSFSSSQESLNSLFSEHIASSQASQTDPESGGTLDSSEEDGASIYSDEELQIIHFDPYLGLIDDDIEVSDFLPWPRRRTSSHGSRPGSSLDSEASDGYESDAEDYRAIERAQMRRRKPRRSRVHYLVEHRQPCKFEVIVPFTEEEKQAYYRAQAESEAAAAAAQEASTSEAARSEVASVHASESQEQDESESGYLTFDSDDEYFSRAPPGYDSDLADDYDGPVEYVVEHIQPTVEILPTLTATQLELLRLGTLPFENGTRLTRPARLMPDGSVEEVVDDEPVSAATTVTPLVSFEMTAAAPARACKFGRSASFESVDLAAYHALAVEGAEHVSAPPTPDLRPWTAAGDQSPSPIMLSSPAFVPCAGFRIVDAPELWGARALAPVQIATVHNPMGDQPETV